MRVVHTSVHSSTLISHQLCIPDCSENNELLVSEKDGNTCAIDPEALKLLCVSYTLWVAISSDEL